MRYRTVHSTTRVGLAAALILSFHAAAGFAQSVPAIDLGYLPPYPHSEARAINDAGQVLGLGATQDEFGYLSQAFVWERGKITPLPSLRRGDDVYDLGVLSAVDINNRGHAVGGALTYDPDYGLVAHGVLWRDGQAIELKPPPGGWVHPYAIDINDHGVTVGASYGHLDGTHVVLWDDDGVFLDLGPPPGNPFDVYSLFINNAGQIAGTSVTSQYGVFYWDRGVWTDVAAQLAAIAGSGFSGVADLNERGQIVGTWVQNEEHGYLQTGFLWSNGEVTVLEMHNALAINDAGDVVGETYSPDEFGNYSWKGVSWSGREVTELPRIPGYTSIGYAINNQGQIMGFAWQDDFVQVLGCIWRNGEIILLEPLAGGSNSYAYGSFSINNRGQVVGWSDAFDPDVGQGYHAVLWNPVP